MEKKEGGDSDVFSVFCGDNGGVRAGVYLRYAV